MSVMVDWIGMVVPFDHSPKNLAAFFDGEVASYTPIPGGGIKEDWRVQKRIQVEGSYSSKVTVKITHGSGGQGSALAPGQPGLYLSGNPAKFFQGHNIFGSSDLHGLSVEMLERVCHSRGATPAPADLEAIYDGRFNVHRSDCTASHVLRDEAQVLAALHALDSSGHMAFRGRGTSYGTSIIFGDKSRRSSLQFYAKGLELLVKGHRISVQVAEHALKAYAMKLLRSEARCLTPFLKEHGLHLAKNWGDNSAADMHRHHIERLSISEATMIEASTLEGLSGRLQLAYDAWKQGKDLRAVLPHNTFYRYRRELLKHGIDIAVKQEARHIEARSMPLRLVVTATPAPIPDWALGTPLYFEPRARFG